MRLIEANLLHPVIDKVFEVCVFHAADMIHAYDLTHIVRSSYRGIRVSGESKARGKGGYQGF
jgi:hypothetical protein